MHYALSVMGNEMNTLYTYTLIYKAGKLEKKLEKQFPIK